MNMGGFWNEKTYLPENAGYSLFSARYFLFLSLCLFIAALAVFLYGRTSEKRKNILLRIFAWIPLGMEILKTIVLLAQDCFTPNYYPIGFCSLVIYLYPLYICIPNGKVREVLRCIICAVMLPAGLVTLLFPNWIGQYPFLSYFSLHSYIWHTHMIVYPLWTWQKEREPLRFRYLAPGFASVLCLIPIIVLINSLAGTNYWFLSAPTDNHPLAPIHHALGTWGYFTILVLVGVAVSSLSAWIQNLFIPRCLKKASTSEPAVTEP